MNYVGNAPAPGGVILVGDTNPVGLIGWFHTPPDGSYLRLNGQAVLKASYPDLWAYAQGFLTADQAANPGLYRNVDGATFALPKLDGLFIRAQGQVDAQHVAAALGVKQRDDIGPSSSQGGTQFQQWGRYPTNPAGFTLSAAANGPDQLFTVATETRPVNVALVPCVKALKTVLMPSVAMPTPAVQLLWDKTAANSASLDFTNLVGYAAYRFLLSNLSPSAGGAHFYLRASTDNGVTFDATAQYTHALSGIGMGGAAVSSFSGGGAIAQGTVSPDTDAAFGVSGEILTNDFGLGRGGHFIVHVGRNSGGIWQHLNGTISYGGNFTPNAVRLLTSTGTIATGRVRCYGLRGA